MAASRISALRYILGAREPFLQRTQRRWAQVHDVRFLATHVQSDRIIERYKEKLERKVKEKGLKSVDELKEVYKDKIQSLKKESPIVPSAHPNSTLNSPFPPPPPPPRIPQPPSQPSHQSSANPKQTPGIKTLSSFLSIPKTLALPPTEIEYIWRLRHASSPRSLCATIPHATYSRLESTARKHPQFIIPLPRPGQGAEIHFLQWTFPSPTTTTILFTHLAEYKLRGEFSQPHTTVTHHLELAGEKGVVLLQGSVLDGRGVTVEEGKWLLMCLQKFYGGEGDRRRLLEQFSQGDGGFKVEELLEEAEKIV